ncbi:MAG: T9SS type A sorting domain-containing protein, partial [Saprospiraceae bacterium]|nr:T9SS type A sorting domain-containing protein [Saprospiraceae bacterium]
LEMDLLESKSLTIRLLNTIGQVVELREGFYPSGPSSLVFDNEGLAPGVYFMEISGGKQVNYLRVVVAR